MRHLIAAVLLSVISVSAVAQQCVPNEDQNRYDRPRADDDDNDDPRPAVFGEDAVITRDGRLEFATIGPPSQANAAANALREAGASLLRTRSYLSLNRYALFVDLRGLSLQRARNALARSAPQTQIDVHSLCRLSQGTPRLYAARMLGVPPGTCRLPGVRIGIIDGPADPSHPALQTTRVTTHSVLRRGERPVGPDHGTAVAALVVGQDPAGALSGFAAGADLFAVGAFARGRRGSAADVERIASALDWLAGNRVQLVNMSFAGPRNAALEDLLAQAARRGTVLIAAAVSSVIAVTAVDAAGRRYRSANTGGHIEFAAPRCRPLRGAAKRRGLRLWYVLRGAYRHLDGGAADGAGRDLDRGRAQWPAPAQHRSWRAWARCAVWLGLGARARVLTAPPAAFKLRVGTPHGQGCAGKRGALGRRAGP